MRISDWSSDVCSSDLTVPIALRCGTPAISPAQRADVVEANAVVTHHLMRGACRQLADIERRSEEWRVGKECGSTDRSCVVPEPTIKKRRRTAVSIRLN